VEYLKTLTEEIENVKESDLEQLAEKFPRGGAIAILRNHPELLSDCKLTFHYRQQQLPLKQMCSLSATDSLHLSHQNISFFLQQTSNC
jgi:hypothetical protein